MNVNFYWSGDDFQFLNRLTLISHYVVGHHPVMWLHGPKPKSPYWIDDIPDIEIRDANGVFDTSGLIKDGVDIRTTSDKFSYYVVKKTGEYYADTDAIALEPWPDQEIVLATYHPDVINVGVIRLPKDHPVLDKCIKTHIKMWGNVHVFTKVVREAGLDYNVPINMFYPVHCGRNMSETMKCAGKIFDNIEIPDGCVSYHYWSNKVSRIGVTHEWADNPKLDGSLFDRLCRWVFSESGYPMIKKECNND